MKKIFILIITLVIFFGFGKTVSAENRVTLTQCATKGGQCLSTLVCPGGDAIKPSDCPATQVCCPITEGNPDVSKCANGDTGIQTAIGCIHALSSSEQFFADILRWAVGIGGGIAFLLIIYAGFMIMTASGNPDRLKAGQELLTSAISGLILLVFSIFILKFIGVDILGLCKFGFGKCPMP